MPPDDIRKPRRRKLLCVGIHLVWSTKYREPCLTPAIRTAVFRYIGGILRSKRGRLLAAGGWTDHIHLYIELPAGIALATLISEIKASSTSWVRRTFPEARLLRWQRSYAAFSVDRRRDHRLMSYILNQEAIHTRRTLQREFSTLCRAYGSPEDDLGD